MLHLYPYVHLGGSEMSVTDTKKGARHEDEGERLFDRPVVFAGDEGGVEPYKKVRRSPQELEEFLFDSSSLSRDED